MVVVSHGLGDLRVYVLSERRVEHSALEIVRGERVACEQTVAVAVFHKGLHGLSRAGVKGERRTHDPNDSAVIVLMAEKLHEIVVILGI